MVAIGINGYGTIGKRVADAIECQPDMHVAGVVKVSPDRGATLARTRAFSLYTPDARTQNTFERAGFTVAGTLADLIDRADIIVDATPGGVGAEQVPYYRDAGIPYILQGAESADLVDESFCTRTNGSDCRSAGSLRVVSCNTTGLARTITALGKAGSIETVHGTLIRRGGDPTQQERGPINDIIPTSGSSHHGRDLMTVIPQLAVKTNAVTVPTTLMHVHSLSIAYQDAPELARIKQALKVTPRVVVVPEDRGLDATAALRDWGSDHGRPRGDIWETCVWDASIDVDDGQVTLFQAIHQESIVIPETIDAIRTLAGEDPGVSADTTDSILGIGTLGDANELRTPVVPAE